MKRKEVKEIIFAIDLSEIQFDLGEIPCCKAASHLSNGLICFLYIQVQ